MIVARRPADLAAPGDAVALTVGVFDGVHRGHRAIVDALRREAAADGARSVVVTLHPHPMEVLRPAFAPKLLSTPDERIALFARTGVDAAMVFDFDAGVAALGPMEFLGRLVPAGVRLTALVIGHDFRMGRGRAAGFEELREEGARAGFRVIQVGPEGGQAPISSTRIRALVAEGDVRGAAELLGHPYLIQGEVIRGRGIGRTLDFPTANVDVGEERKLLPKLGVYAVFVGILGGGDAVRPGVMNLGTRPTFGGGEAVLEVHLPGFEGDLLGRRLAVELVERIRDEERFDGPEALAARIEQDVAKARKVLEKREI